MAARAEHTRSDIARLVHRGLGVREFSLAAARALRRAVPFDGVCVVTMDPATLLPTGHVIENGLPESSMARYIEIELHEDDVNKLAELARGRGRAATLAAATGGVLDRSARHRELRGPNGFGDELRAAFVGDSGTWGAIVLLREAGSPDFALADARLLESVSGLLSEGLRRAMLVTALGGAGQEPGTDAGLLLLADDGTIESANAAAQVWLDELGAAPTPGSVLGEGDEARAAVILEQAQPVELAPLIAEAYALTPREQAVTQLVAHGLSTNEIAGRLFLSPYTVQDHLKAIFEKVGVSTRGELVARLFFEHYAPRLRNAA